MDPWIKGRLETAFEHDTPIGRVIAKDRVKPPTRFAASTESPSGTEPSSEGTMRRAQSAPTHEREENANGACRSSSMEAASRGTATTADGTEASTPTLSAAPARDPLISLEHLCEAAAPTWHGSR